MERNFPPYKERAIPPLADAPGHPGAVLVSNPTDQEQEEQEQKGEKEVSRPLPAQHSHLSRAGIVSLLVLIGMLLVLITGLLIANPSELSPQAALTPTSTTSPASPTGTHAPTPTPTLAANVTPTPEPPIFTANSGAIPSLQLPTGHYVLYEQQNSVYMISSDGGLPQVIPTEGYIY
ncbi:MAG TPA: hypothetical protein VFQ30_17965, partial [Ktedonobacteraceae bacterium]|nr:hypothetical protein [Ktedonobacteraceae bacterium]